MNILYISSEYPPETGHGGIGTYTKHISEGMAERGHTVSVIALSTTGDNYTSTRKNIIIHRIIPHPYPLPSFHYAYPFRRFCLRFFPHSLNRLSWALAVGQYTRHLVESTGKLDIIEAPECGAESMFIPRNASRKRVVRLHTPWEIIRRLDNIRDALGDYFLLPYFEQRTTRHADGVSAPSKAIVSQLIKRWHLQSTTVIPNPFPALPVASESIPCKKKWIYVGRIERRKGVHHLIVAYGNLYKRQQLPPLKLVGKAYGTDKKGINYGATIRLMIDDFGLSDSIEWVEKASLDEVNQHLQSANVAFFPSLWENYPYACLEAMATGCAVVATDCGGFPEIINDREHGFLITPDSTESIEKTMQYILENQSEVTDYGRKARQHVAELTSLPRICLEMERFYSQLLESSS